MRNNPRFAFFGTSHIATMVLDELEKSGLLPALIVSLPPKKRGRGLQEKQTDVEQWARSHGIDVMHANEGNTNILEYMSMSPLDVAIVVDYGKILPQTLLAIPKKGFLNVHPSLLPRFRGASPVRSAILNNERETGVSIFVLDDKMDHGPILAQKKVAPEKWPLKNSEMERVLLPLGGSLLAQILPEYVAGNVEPREQNHDIATYCTKFSKEDGLLDLHADPHANLLKVRAFEGWPGTYAFFSRAGKRLRVNVIEAHVENGRLVPDTVKPEGKKEMPYEDFLLSGAKPL